MYAQFSRSVGRRRPASSNSRGSYHSQSQRPSSSRGPRAQIIDSRRFIKAAKPFIAEEVYIPKHQFADFEVHPVLMANIISRGYVKPMPIQDQAIPAGLEGKDIVGLANTGAGKTMAFAIPLLHRLLNDRSSSALIIAPTRELAQQIEAECRIIAKGSGLAGVVLIGGTSMSNQLRDLKHNPCIIIGTPGRIKDHVQRGSLDLSRTQTVVLDEVDRMVDMGFIADIKFLLGSLSTKRQSYFFSATLDPKLDSLVRSFMNEPVTISVKTGETSDNIHQDVVPFTSKEDKVELLAIALTHEATKKTLIFDSTQRSVERLSETLNKRGFKVDAIHGGKSQGARQRALSRFKKNEIDVLVATDVAARGIDVSDITHVINFSQPNTYEDYVHRIGRAGRAGNVGYALTFVPK